MYYLVSGRWFTAPDFNGPWTFATPNLPDDFKKIPLSHERSRVLASVPGTDQAAEAVLLAQIPETARVDKKQVKAPEVQYQGEPQFQPIEQTTVSRAMNTDKDIIKVGDLYYMCFQGVWFMGRSPNGPWEVTGSVPGQIYEIPVSSPAYNVTNVTVVEDNSDAVVFATAAAYTGMMVAWGCAVWGTGYYYPPYVYYGGFYPVVSPLLPDLRLPRVVQPLDRHLQPRRGGVRSVRRRRRRRAVQPEHRYLRARRRGVGTVRRPRRRGRLQPAHRRVGRDAPGLECLRQLGSDRRAARQSVGHDSRVDQQRHRHDDARDAGQRRRRGRHAERPARHRRRRPHRQRRRLRRPRRQRLPEAGRRLAAVRQRRRQLELGPGDARAAPAGAAARDRGPRSGVHAQRDGRFIHGGTAQSRFGRARGRRAAHARRTAAPSRSGSSGSSYRPSGGDGARSVTRGGGRPATPLARVQETGVPESWFG